MFADTSPHGDYLPARVYVCVCVALFLLLCGHHHYSQYITSLDNNALSFWGLPLSPPPLMRCVAGSLSRGGGGGKARQGKARERKEKSPAPLPPYHHDHRHRCHRPPPSVPKNNRAKRGEREQRTNRRNIKRRRRNRQTEKN